MSDALRRLAAVCSSMPPAKKSATGHQHRYLDLPGLLAHVTPQLAAQGLAAVSEVTTDEHGRVGCRYLFVGPDDVHETPWFWLPPARDAQTAGGSITYARRFVLSSACGVPEQETVATAAPKKAAAKKAGLLPQVKNLQIAFTEAGVKDRGDRLNYVIDVIGRPVESSKELSNDEIDRVLKALSTDKRNH